MPPRLCLSHIYIYDNKVVVLVPLNSITDKSIVFGSDKGGLTVNGPVFLVGLDKAIWIEIFQNHSMNWGCPNMLPILTVIMALPTSPIHPR
jgi:hypothetical protein